MSTWRDSLRKARYRGAEFLVDSAEGTVGRRTVLHEYPLRDLPFVEDLGRKARTFTIEAYVLATGENGFNHMPARDLLLAAIERPGPGPLVHPWLGEMQMVVTESRLRESTAEGGMARFTLTCVEAGQQEFPQADSNTGALVEDAADLAELGIAEDFSSSFSVDNRPEFVPNAAIEVLNSAVAGVRAAVNAMPTTSGPLSDFLPRLNNMSNQLATLVRAPATLATTVIGLMNGLRGIVAAPQHALAGLRALFGFGSGLAEIAVATPSRIQQAANQAAMVALVQRTALAEAARVAAEIEFASFDDADSVRTELADGIDALMLVAADPMYDELVALRSAMIRDITSRGADLARLVDYVPRATLPALAIAYDLYDDPGRDAEIIARNRAVREAPTGPAKPTFLWLPGVSGNDASTPDSAALAITGDIDIRVRVACNDWTAATGFDFLSKELTDSSQFSYLFRLTNGFLGFYWSEDGTTLKSVGSTAPLGLADGSTKWVRVTLDVNNGAAGNDAKFYTSDDGVVWRQLGATVTTATATSIFDSTAALHVGGDISGVAGILAGRLYYLELRNGIDGPLAVSFDPLDGEMGATSFISAGTGELWTINQFTPGEPKARLAGALAQNAGFLPGIRHPGFVSGGRAIEVLSDA